MSYSQVLEVPGGRAETTVVCRNIICEFRSVTAGLPFLPEEENLSESSSESFLWSDEEYGQDVDVTTNPDEELDGDDRYDFEVVRCICEVQEENDFMIQASRTQDRGRQTDHLRECEASMVVCVCVCSPQCTLLTAADRACALFSSDC